MAANSTCEKVLKAAPHFQIPGLSERESVAAVCKVVEYGGGGADLAETNGKPDEDAVKNAVMVIRRTAFPGFGRDTAVVGKDGKQQIGLQHIVSADNGAAYWELWHRGGNWYAVTGADRGTGTLLKKAEGEADPYEVPGVKKGMGIDEVLPRFLRNFFGPSQISNGQVGGSGAAAPCGCGKK